MKMEKKFCESPGNIFNSVPPTDYGAIFPPGALNSGKNVIVDEWLVYF